MTVLDPGLGKIPVEVNNLKRNSVFIKNGGDYPQKPEQIFMPVKRSKDFSILVTLGFWSSILGNYV